MGASGAVSAVVLSFIMFEPDAPLMLIFLPGVNIPGWVFALLYLGYSHYMAKKAIDNIGHEAHLWGGRGRNCSYPNPEARGGSDIESLV